MKTMPLLRMLIALGITCLFDSCAHRASVSGSRPVNPEVASIGRQLGFSDLANVRAYVINAHEEYPSPDEVALDDRGHLTKKRFPREGLSLTVPQIERFQKAVTGNHHDYLRMACFYPHHAFVFFDSRGKIIGHLTLCFMCAGYEGSSGFFAKNIDFQILASLCKELGLPIQVGAD